MKVSCTACSWEGFIHVTQTVLCPNCGEDALIEEDEAEEEDLDAEEEDEE